MLDILVITFWCAQLPIRRSANFLTCCDDVRGAASMNGWIVHVFVGCMLMRLRWSARADCAALLARCVGSEERTNDPPSEDTGVLIHSRTPHPRLGDDIVVSMLLPLKSQTHLLAPPNHSILALTAHAHTLSRETGLQQDNINFASLTSKTLLPLLSLIE